MMTKMNVMTIRARAILHKALFWTDPPTVLPIFNVMTLVSVDAD